MLINDLLDACEYVLENMGETQSSYWLASQVVEMKFWRATEAAVQQALMADIRAHGESSRFRQGGENEFAGGFPAALRSQD